jgi:hypothetical protein
VQVKGVQPGTAGFEAVLALAARVLTQDRYLTWHFPDARGRSAVQDDETWLRKAFSCQFCIPDSAPRHCR